LFALVSPLPFFLLSIRHFFESTPPGEGGPLGFCFSPPQSIHNNPPCSPSSLEVTVLEETRPVRFFGNVGNGCSRLLFFSFFPRGLFLMSLFLPPFPVDTKTGDFFLQVDSFLFCGCEVFVDLTQFSPLIQHVRDRGTPGILCWGTVAVRGVFGVSGIHPNGAVTPRSTRRLVLILETFLSFAHMPRRRVPSRQFKAASGWSLPSPLHSLFVFFQPTYLWLTWALSPLVFLRLRRQCLDAPVQGSLPFLVSRACNATQGPGPVPGLVPCVSSVCAFLLSGEALSSPNSLISTDRVVKIRTFFFCFGRFFSGRRPLPYPAAFFLPDVLVSCLPAPSRFF